MPKLILLIVRLTICFWNDAKVVKTNICFLKNVVFFSPEKCKRQKLVKYVSVTFYVTIGSGVAILYSLYIGGFYNSFKNMPLLNFITNFSTQFGPSLTIKNYINVFKLNLYFRRIPQYFTNSNFSRVWSQREKRVNWSLTEVSLLNSISSLLRNEFSRYQFYFRYVLSYNL